MSIITRNRISGVVCRFSTGSEAPYYGRVEEWFYPLKYSLQKVGVVILSECPTFGPDPEGGDGYLSITNGKEDLYIFYTYYPMSSGRWEVVCYLT
jgi:hypothetical protein